MTAARACLSDASWRTALWLDDHDHTRPAARWWHHYGSRTIPMLTPAAIALPFADHLLYALAPMVLATLAMVTAGHVASRAHEIGLEDERHCPLCPPAGDDDGHGWGRPGDGSEPTGGPLDPFTADEVHMLEFQYRTQVTR